jgi:PAS domain S-box-containing protein
MMDHFPIEARKILKILKNSPHGMSITEIAREIQKNKHSVGRYLEILHVSGRVEMRMYGKAKVFTSANRIPQDSLLNHSREFILMIDEDKRILHVNNFFLDLINLPREVILGKNILFISESSFQAQTILNSIQSCLKAGMPECEIFVGDDIKKTYFMRVVSMVFNDGTKGSAISLEDISDRKNATLLEYKYKALLNLLSDAIYQGILIAENERIVFANKPAEELFELVCEGLPLFYLLERIMPENRNHIKKLFSEYQKDTQKPLEIEFGVDGPTGIRKIVKGRFIVFGESGEETCLLLLTNVSE